VSIRFKNFHTIDISIGERQPKALWCGLTDPSVSLSKISNDCFVFDETGLVFASSTEAANIASGMIKFSGGLSAGNPIGQHFLSAEHLEKLFEFVKNISVLGFGITEFRVRSEGIMEAVFPGGQRLIFGNDTDLVAAVANLQAVLDDPVLGASNLFTKMDYIDLRFGNKVYYKLKN
jgi:hypothetical protein